MRRKRSTKNKKSPTKALTIRQPWAELILKGRKPFDLRSWRTHYRGPLVIHAAARVDSEDARLLGMNPEKLPISCFVGVATLQDVRPFTRADARLLKKKRAHLGSWQPNYFSWVLKKPRRISSPFKAKGRLGLFKVPRGLKRRIAKLLSVGG